MEYRLKANELIHTLVAWNELLSGKGKIHLIACGGTALTLLGYKESTKDVDFLVPNEDDYERLIEFLTKAGYELVTGYGWQRSGEITIFDLYPGNKVYSTELLDSPLSKNGNKKIKEWKRIYLGVLNPIDLVISKMFRGTEADVQDSLILFQNEKIDVAKFEQRYRKTAKYETNEDKMLKSLDYLLMKLKRMDRKANDKK